MHNSFNFMGATLALSALCACHSGKVVTPNFKAPDIRVPSPNFEMPDLSLFSADRKCEKTEQQQSLSKEAAVNRVAVSDQIDVQDVETVNCSKTVQSRGHKPVRPMRGTIQIAPPSPPLDNINFVEIENQRNCHVIRVNPGDMNDEDANIQIPLRSGKVKLGQFQSDLKQNNRLDLQVTDANHVVALLLGQLQVMNGVNAVQIRYLGKCLEYKDKVDPKLKDSANCKTAEILSSKDLILDVKIDLVEKPGVHRSDLCVEATK